MNKQTKDKVIEQNAKMEDEIKRAKEEINDLIRQRTEVESQL